MNPYYHDEVAGITIFCGDCRDILPSIAPKSVDLLLTDPPYGISLHTDGGPTTQPLSGMGNRTKTSRRVHRPIHGDDEPFDPSHLLRFPRIVLFGGNYYADKLPPSRGWIVWDKREGRGSDFASDCELAWTNLGNRVRMYSQMWRGMICKGEENGRERLHPTQKPVALMTWILEQWTHPNDLILDPYMGSGTTLVAAHRLGRKAIGIELNERYCEIAVRRLQQAVLPLEMVAD